MPLPESLCSTLFATVYKRPLEGGLRAFAFCLLGFYFGDLLFGAFLWAFWCGKLLKRKKIVEGKMLKRD
jgi:hypothetical protein